MKRRESLIKTKRLELYPLSDSEIQDLIDHCPEEELQAAYQQMLEGCRENPDQRHWYAPWTMELKKEKIRIGELGFRGAATDYSVEIGYGITKEYEGQGYTAEAVETLVNWALDNEEVMFVEAEAAEENAASIHILEKLGFEKYGQGEEGPRFVKFKSESYYGSIGMCLGLCFGMSMGMLIFDNIGIGILLGLAIGFGLGSAKDKQNKEKTAGIKREKYQKGQ